MNPFCSNPSTKKITFQLGNVQGKCMSDHDRQINDKMKEYLNDKFSQSHSFIQDSQFVSRQMQFTLECYYTSIGYDKKPNVSIVDYKYQFKPYQTLSQIIYQPNNCQEITTKYKKVLFAKEHRSYYNKVKLERKLFFRKVQDLIYFCLGRIKLGSNQNIQSQQLYTLFCCRKTKPEVNMPSFLQSIQYTNRLAYLQHLICQKQKQFQVFEGDQFQRLKKLIEDEIYQIQAMYYWCFDQIHFLQQSFQDFQILTKQFQLIQGEILKPNQIQLFKKVQYPQFKEPISSNIHCESIVQQSHDTQQQNKNLLEPAFQFQEVHQILSEEQNIVVQINDQSDQSIVNIPKKNMRSTLPEKQKQDLIQIGFQEQFLQNDQNKFVSVQVKDKKIFLKKSKTQNTNKKILQNTIKGKTQDKYDDKSVEFKIEENKSMQHQINFNKYEEEQLQKIMNVGLNNQQLCMPQNYEPIQQIKQQIQQKQQEINQINIQTEKENNKMIQEKERPRSHRNQGYFFSAKNQKQTQKEFDY